MARLVIFDRTVRGVDLAGRRVVLGRSRSADVPIRDAELSRRHCALEPSGEEGVREVGARSGYRVVDLGSANGTYVNGVRVERCSLRHDDILEIGKTVIVLLDEAPGLHPGAVAGLRNPQKAARLISRVRGRAWAPSSGGRRAPAEPRPPLAEAITPEALLAALDAGTRSALTDHIVLAAAVDLLRALSPSLRAEARRAVAQALGARTRGSGAPGSSQAAADPLEAAREAIARLLESAARAAENRPQGEP